MHIDRQNGSVRSPVSKFWFTAEELRDILLTHLQALGEPVPESRDFIDLQWHPRTHREQQSNRIELIVPHPSSKEAEELVKNTRRLIIGEEDGT